MGDFHEVLNFNQLFLKRNRFINNCIKKDILVFDYN